MGVLLLLAACAPASPPPAAPTPVVVASAPPPPAPAPAPAPPASAAAATPADPSWTSMGGPSDRPLLESAIQSWSRATQCPDYDYYPSGGIQNFWCHRPEGLTLEKVRSLAGVDLFVSGPHTPAALRLDSAASFGHYNPAFVRWLVDSAGPASRDSAVRKATQGAYDASLRPLAAIFWKVHLKIESDPACFKRERDAYAAMVAGKRLPARHHERWFFFMNPEFCPRAARGLVATNPMNETYFYDHGMDGGVNGNVTKSVVGFWVRRSLDGTRDTFVEGLRKLIVAYDPSVLDAPLPAPGAPPPPRPPPRPRPSGNIVDPFSGIR